MPDPRSAAQEAERLEADGPHLAAVVEPGRFAGRDDGETAAVLALLEDATDYLLSIGSDTPVGRTFVGRNSGPDVATFLFQVGSAARDGRPWRWVVVGDVPPAVLPADGVPDAGAALRRYAAEVARWVEAVRTDAPMDHVIALDVPPTRAYADLLEDRMRTLVGPARS